MIWLVWIAVALLALIGEAVTTSLVLASFALAALITSPLSLLMPLPFQVVVFAVLSLVLLLAVRPAALRFLPGGAGDEGPQGSGPVGREAVALQRIDHRSGQIRIGQSEFWTARPIDASIIPPGRQVEVVRIDGLTAIVRLLENSRRTEGEPPTSTFGLSSREIEVLKLIVEGKTNAEIASTLVLSTRTVDHHVSHILDKMAATSRVDAVRMAIESGLVAPRPS